MIARSSGKNRKCIAIVSNHDQQSASSLANNGFETVSVNGNRMEEIIRVQKDLRRLITERSVRRVVLVPADSAFTNFCEVALQVKETNVSA
jgi:hypothetical protein